MGIGHWVPSNVLGTSGIPWASWASLSISNTNAKKIGDKIENESVNFYKEPEKKGAEVRCSPEYNYKRNVSPGEVSSFLCLQGSSGMHGYE